MPAGTRSLQREKGAWVLGGSLCTAAPGGWEASLRREPDPLCWAICFLEWMSLTSELLQGPEAAWTEDELCVCMCD